MKSDKLRKMYTKDYLNINFIFLSFKMYLNLLPFLGFRIQKIKRHPIAKTLLFVGLFVSLFRCHQAVSHEP